MGQCVSISRRIAGTGNGEPEPRCQVRGCRSFCEAASRSQYCAQHTVCRQQGCARPRYRNGPYCQKHLYTCRAPRCSNDQAGVLDAWFTNTFCLEHQPDAVLEAYFRVSAPEAGISPGADTKSHQKRARRRRSHQKTRHTPASPPATREISEDIVSALGIEDALSSSHQGLSTEGEEADGDGAFLLSVTKSGRGHQDLGLELEPEPEPEPPTPRRSQKTVHFADSPPRASSPEKSTVTTADLLSMEPMPSSSDPHLRSSRHRRRVDSRHGSRSSPRNSSSSAISAGYFREKRSSTGSSVGASSIILSKTADVKRTTRTRPNH